MRRSTRLAAAGVVLAVTLTGCGDAKPSPPTPADLDEIDLSVDHTVIVSEDGYDPASLEVTAGEVVRLSNEGTSPHSFTADDRQFDTGRMDPGEDTTLVLTEPGKVTFYDLEEPDHTGTIDVRPQG